MSGYQKRSLLAATALTVAEPMRTECRQAVQRYFARIYAYTELVDDVDVELGQASTRGSFWPVKPLAW